MYRYKAKITRVIDGDTLEATVDLGFNISIRETFRLIGIDTPEIFRPKYEGEKEHGLQAKSRVSELVLNKDVILETSKTGKYGRWIANIIMEDQDKTLTEILIEENYTKKPPKL